MGKLLTDEHLLKDDENAYADYFAEEENDDDFAEDMSEEDIIDDDFDEPEDFDDEEDEVETNERSLRKDERTEKSKKTAPFMLPRPKRGPPGQGAEPFAEKKARKARDPLELSATDRGLARTIRGSTKAKTADSEKRKVITEADRFDRASKRSDKPKIYRRLTQEDMLNEAKITEIINKRSLKRLLEIEEEHKRIPRCSKRFTPAIVRTTSGPNGSVVIFPDEATASCINQLPIPYVHTHICGVTGQPAKYLDPQTNFPYTTIDAFKAIRERYHRLEDSKCDLEVQRLRELLAEKKRQRHDLLSSERRHKLQG